MWTPGIACSRGTPLAANKNMKQQQQMQHSLQRCNTGCSNNESRDVALVAQSGYRLHSLVTEIQKWGLKPTLAAETELWEGDRDTLWGRYTALAEHIEHWLITACRDAVLAARSSTGCSDPALAGYTALIGDEAQVGDAADYIDTALAIDPALNADVPLAADAALAAIALLAAIPALAEDAGTGYRCRY